MNSTTTCDNLACACDPCRCKNCTCGAARLGELERQVMDILWERPERELTARDVADALPDYAYTTVATVLDRLVHKQLVLRRKGERALRFTPIGTRGSYTAVLMHEALGVDGDADAALVRFAQTLLPSEAAVLRRTLNAMDRNSLKSR